MTTLTTNLQQVQEQIAVAAKRAGRDPGDVTLIGVTKYVDAATTRALFESGCLDLGESRPQVLWDKTSALADLSARWHMIGHLQRNKVKRTVACSDLIHSVDSLRLIQAIEEAGQGLDKVVEILLEVNVSGESAKHGFKRDEIKPAIELISGLSHVQVRGLMAMASLAGDSGDARREFASLRELKETLRTETSANVQFDELSMGMSGDFEIAIEEGATLVRIGSRLFEGV